MSNREDYLDSLLNSVTNREDELDGLFMQDTEDDFLSDFDQEMSDIDTSSFLSDFEMELEGNSGLERPKRQEPDSFEDPFEEPENVMVDTMEPDEFEGMEPNEFEGMEPEPEVEPGVLDPAVNDVHDEVDLDQLLNDAMEQPIPEQSMMDQEQPEPAGEAEVKDSEREPIGDDDQDILDILSGLNAEDDFGDIENMLKENDGDDLDLGEGFSDLDEGLHEGSGQMYDTLEMDEDFDLADLEEKEDTSKKKRGKKEKKKKGKRRDGGESEEKGGFFHKISKTFFGEDEEESDDIEVDNLILEKEKAEKLAKKKEKQEQKEEKKKEKEEKKAEKEEKKKAEAAKKAEEKAKKAEKKKANEPNVKSKPLPRGPVILIFAMGISIVILVNLFSSLVGYTNGLDQAKDYYGKGDFVGAYGILSGMKIKETDQDLFQKAKLAAILQKDFNSYEAYQKSDMYPEALNSLICGIGRYDKYIDEAKEAGVEKEYADMLAKFQNALEQLYSVDMEQAKEMYAGNEREDYTLQLYRLLEQGGFRE